MSGIDPDLLYRGLRPPEIVARRLIPKRPEKFAQAAKLPVRLPFVLGSTIENAARNHQKAHGDLATIFETSGVSTTKNWRIAVGYATENGAHAGYVAVIRRGSLGVHGISEYDVVARCPEVIKPEDEEVILYGGDGSPFPSEIIDSIVKVEASEFSPV